MQDVEKGGNLFTVNASNGVPRKARSLAAFVQAKFKPARKGEERNTSFGWLECQGSEGLEFKARRPFLRLDGRRIDADYLEDVYHLLTNFWNAPHPNFLLEVTGSAEEFSNLTNEQLNKLKKAVQIQSCAYDRTKSVWVVTGGCDCGCMRLVGEALWDDDETPCIGFATWSHLLPEDRKVMENACGMAVPYSRISGNKKKLNLHHNCFLLVDNDTEGTGQEIGFRNVFLDYVSQAKFSDPIPAGLLVIGGGPNSLKTAELCVAAQDDDLNAGRLIETRPLIVLKGTGRSADAIEIAIDFCSKNKDYSFADFKKAMLHHASLFKTIIGIFGKDHFDAGISRAFKNMVDTPLAKMLKPPWPNSPKSEDFDAALEWVLFALHRIALRRHLVTIVDAFSGDSNPPTFSEIDQELSSQNGRTLSFVENNFSQTRCDTFKKIDNMEKARIEPNLLKTLNAENLCRCGRDDHPKVVAAQRSGILKFGLPERTPLVRMSFMEFVPSYSKFIRLSYDSNLPDEALFMQKVYTLMTEFWRMPLPQLLIEVAGTADDMRLVDSEMIKLLTTGLIRMAKKSRAWLIAGGGNCGVMKLVGDAVDMDRKTHNSFSVPCLGIAPWGMIENRDEIFKPSTNPISSKYGLVNYPFKNDDNYVERQERGNHFELNPGYDFFILVDTCKENRFGEELEFREKLVEYLSDQKPYKSKQYSMQTPSVLLVVGGGPSILNAVVDAIHCVKGRPRPVVVLKGFGGCSDFLATAFEKLSEKTWENDIQEEKFFKMIVSRDPSERSAEAIFPEVKAKLEFIFKNQDLVTILDMGKSGNQSLDDAILEAIFKRDPSDVSKKAIKGTFELCLLWNRFDFAQKILNDRLSFNTIQKAEKKNGFVNKAMTSAIKRNQAKLFELFLTSGLVEPGQYFIGENDKQIGIILHKLFWHPSTWKASSKIIPGRYLQFFQHLLQSSHREPKLGPDLAYRLKYDDSDIAGAKLSEIQNMVEPVFRSHFRLPKSLNLRIEFSVQNDVDLQYDISIRNLFLVKLLLCRDDFALVLWKRCQVSDFLGTAIMASIYLERLGKAADAIQRRDLCESYLELSQKWEKRSLALIQELSEMQPKTLAKILTRSLRTWHGINVLQMAYHGEKMSIMAHSAVQIELEKVWKGRGSSDNVKKPKAGSTRKTKSKWFPCCSRKYGNQSVAPTGKVESKTGKNAKQSSKRLEALRQMLNVSPEIKFGLHTTFLLMFLFVLFGDVIYTAHGQMSCQEMPNPRLIILWITALAFVVDAIQEMILFDGVTVDNATTLIGGGFMLISFILRMICFKLDVDGLVYSFSRIFHVVCSIFFWAKVFRILFVWKSLGPKVLTFYELFKPVGFFIVLHFIVLFAFAAPIYALTAMPDNRDGNGDTNEYFALMARVIYNRWWQIVGIYMDTSRDTALGSSCVSTLLPHNTFKEDDYTPISTTAATFVDNSTSIFASLLPATTAAAVTVSMCDFRRIISSILLMVFFLLTNIVLLNLLIASFAHVVDTYREEAENVFKFTRYHLIRCFAEKPVLPPPLNLLKFLNPKVIIRCCLPKSWNKRLEMQFSEDADDYKDGDDNNEKKWKNKYQLAKYRYRELNFLEKTAVSIILRQKEDE